MTTSFDSVQLPAIAYQNINNIIDNGGFDIWQRGTTFTNPASVYVADRWFVANAGGAATSTITKETSVTDNTAAALKWNITSNAGNGQAYLLQYVENFAALRGKTVTVTIRSQQSVTGFLLGIYDGVTATTTPLGSNVAYTTYSLTVTLSASATTLFIFWGNNGTPIPVGTFYLDSVMLTIGSSNVSFVPTNPQVDLARCQRYYEQTPSGSDQIYSAVGATTNVNYVMQLPVNFKVSKRIAPTITLTTNFLREEGSVTDSQASYTKSASGATTEGFYLNASKAIGGSKPSSWDFTWTASADL